MLDAEDAARTDEVRALGLRVAAVPTLMRDPDTAAALARTALAL